MTGPLVLFLWLACVGVVVVVLAVLAVAAYVGRVIAETAGADE